MPQRRIPIDELSAVSQPKLTGGVDQVANENFNRTRRDQVSPPHDPHDPRPTLLSLPFFSTSINFSSEGLVINNERRCTSFSQHPATTTG
jgi:hypothetical protein